MTVVHDPRDSRIWFRQIHALLQQGWDVTYAAPFLPGKTTAPEHLDPELAEHLRLVRLHPARGRHRLHAAVSARRLLRREHDQHDVILIHDPELLLVTIGLQLPHLVWDVHEDTAATLAQKAWLPTWLRRPAALAVTCIERWAERRYTLILAEAGYQRRFRRHHTVVPNAVTVPERILPVSSNRVVYLGTLTPARGSDQLLTIGTKLREKTEGMISLEVIGPTHDEHTRQSLLRAHETGNLTWHGYLPADQALRRLPGALAGLSLLRDNPNFRQSMPTKVVEYCAYGVPVITTPLPLAVELVQNNRAGLVVPWDNPTAVVDAVLTLFRYRRLAQRMANRGHHAVSIGYDWRQFANVFTAELASVASRVRSSHTF